jgi:ribulose kinase
VAEKLKRHLIQEENFQESDSKKKSFIRSHDEKLLLITGKVFGEIYRYTEAIKQKIEKLYSCSLKLDEEAAVFQRFIDAYFRGTGESA